MSTIHWASAVSGTFSTAQDWLGGMVPGPTDTAVIDAVPNLRFQSYTVQLITPTTLGGLVLNAKRASLIASANVTAGSVAVQAGRLIVSGASLAGSTTLSGGLLELNHASFAGGLTQTGGTLRLSASTVSGTVTEQGGTVQFGGGTVLDHVSWRGALDPRGRGALRILGSLTLTGADGTGPGSASFDRSVVLDGVTTLDNATISMGAADLTLQGSNSLTLGAHLTLDDAHIKLSGGESLVNRGTLAEGVEVLGGHVINDGSISGSFSEAAASFVNNGSISQGAGQVLGLTLQGLQPAGAQGSITLNGGDLVLTGTLTTAQLQALYAAQHITGDGAQGLGLVGALDNSNATLTVGTGSPFGTLYAGGAAEISGGTILDWGGTQGGALTLDGVTYVTTTGTASLGSDIWNDVALSGAATVQAGDLTLNGGTLSGVGTLDIGNSLTLNNTDISGVGNNGQVSVNFSATGAGQLTLGAGQSVSGYNFHFGDPGFYASGQVFVAGGLTLDHTQFSFTSGPANAIVDSSTSQGITLGSLFSASISTGNLDILGQGKKSVIASSGTFVVQNNMLIGFQGLGVFGTYDTYMTNSGRITVGAGGYFGIDAKYGHLTNTGTLLVQGGTLEVSATDLVNTGVVSVAGGTLVLDGKLALADLNTIPDPGSALQIAGTLSLGGQTVTPGSGGVQDFSLAGGTLTNGTLAVSAGNVFDAVTTNNFDTTRLDTAVTNNGTIVASLGSNAEVDQSQLEITGTVSGNGTIEFTSGGSDGFTNFCTVKLDGSVSAGQTLSFVSGYDSLEFASKAATQGFAGTLAGLDSGGNVSVTLQLDHQSIQSVALHGADILIDFSNGGSAVLAADTTLKGSISFFNSGGNGIIEYNRAAAARVDYHAEPGATHHVSWGGWV